MKYQRINSGVISKIDCESLISEINRNSLNIGFGVRHFLRENLTIYNLLQENYGLQKLVRSYFKNPVIIKSIYFDKPPKSNWPVNWHQDITINLTEKVENLKFKNCRILEDRVVVQPNLELLESILTFRIHLDKADANNGALSVINDSEDDKIIRIDKDYLESKREKMSLAEIDIGGVMIMSPLTVHSSKRSKSNNFRRRVIHLEVIEKCNLAGLPFIESFEL